MRYACHSNCRSPHNSIDMEFDVHEVYIKDMESWSAGMDFLLRKYMCSLIFTELDSISIIVLLYSETINECYICSNKWSYVFIRFSLAHRVFTAILCLPSRYFGALSIFTGKADAKNFAVLVFTRNASFQLIWSDISGHVTVLRTWLLQKKTDYK